MPGKRKLSRDKWSLNEKKKLKLGLERYGKDDIEKLHAFIPNKSKSELETFIRRLHMQELYHERKMKGSNKNTSLLSPIEMWLQVAEDLTEHETDFSFVLGQVMGILEHLEPKQDLPESTGSPDFSKIYGYIRAVQSNQDTPDLNPIESAVILDILGQLADHIKECDMTEQRNLMLEKYRLMNVKVLPENKQEGYKTIQKALTDEPTTSKSQAASQPHTNDQQERIGTTDTLNRSTNLTPEKNPTLTKAVNENRENSKPIQESSIQNEHSSTSGQSQGTATKTAANYSGEEATSQLQKKTVTKQTEKTLLQKTSNPSSNLNSQTKAATTKISQTNKPPKTQLYSLNPFCIPVKYLNPQKKKR